MCERESVFLGVGVGGKFYCLYYDKIMYNYRMPRVHTLR